MKRHLTILSIFLLAATFASAQTLREYLELRKKHGISRAVGIEALDAFVGTRVLEIQGVIKGTFGINGKTIYLVERPDESHLEISSGKPIEWLTGSEVYARMIIRASRSEENGRLESDLLGAAPEVAIAKIEEVAAAKTKPIPSSNSNKTAKPSGKSNGILFGPIGKGGGSSSPPPKNWNLSSNEAVPVYARFIKGYNKKLSDGQALEIANGIVGFSIRYGVDARLIMAMVLVESGFNPGDTSYAGAMGLGQLMPGTAKGLGITNAYDTYQNLYGTTRVIRGHIERYSKKTDSSYEALVLALAAYNAGSGAVRRHGGVPPYKQTVRYIEKVITTYRGFLGK